MRDTEKTRKDSAGRICAIGKYVGLGFTPWDGVTGPTHRQHLASATFASDMAMPKTIGMLTGSLNANTEI